MECNKEEAIRAKGIAEKKMESKDFAGARKIAIKAQRLYPELENISRMICVCDVHCSAESKKVGSERDWYDILKVEQSADEVSIKKQYRKLALLLHPDKNNFGGAEAAFMLIGEAQKVLLDKERRSSFDARYRTLSQNASVKHPPQANKNTNNMKPPPGQNTNSTKNASSHVKKQQSQQPPQDNTGDSGEQQTFWTICPFCEVKYRYHKIALNKDVLCQSCKKNFIAYDMYAESTNQQSNEKHSTTAESQGTSGQVLSGSKANQTAAHAGGGVSNQGGSRNASNGKIQGDSCQRKPEAYAFAKPGQFAKVDMSKKTNELNMGAKYINRTSVGPNDLRTDIGKGEKKQVGQPEGSIPSQGGIGRKDKAVEKEGAAGAGAGPGNDSNTRQRRSSKRNVSGTDIGSDDGTLNLSKRSKANAQSSSPTKQASPAKVGSVKNTKSPDLSDTSAKEMANGNVPVKESTPQKSRKASKIAKDKPDENDCVNSNSLPSGSNSNEPDPIIDVVTKKQAMEVPDSDFGDFDTIRKKSNFKPGQVWAIYDAVDAMPRYYAQINKVFSSGFKLRITWLESAPDDEDALLWVENNMPVSCGKFQMSYAENAEDRFMFSHPICWEKGHGKKAVITILPKKDETWAVFRDWHRDWKSSNPEDHTKYEYKFVLVLSDYDERVGVRVAVLGKLRGFSSLFCQKGTNEIQIPPSEYLRFSHSVPSYRMTGKEREGVPRGSFELDPACIPPDFEEMPLPPEETKSEMVPDHTPIPGVVVKENEPGCQNQKMDIDEKNQSTSGGIAEHAVTESSSLEACELPDTEFFNFDAIRALDMFQAGQVWALYSDAGAVPNFYGLIKKVDKDSEKKLQVLWLEGISPPNALIRWKNSEMPISCGKFKIKNPRPQNYVDPSPFSHQVQSNNMLKTKVFEIFPRTGEIWAMFKNWNVDMTPSDLDTCEYDIVEILEETIKGSNTKVLAMEKVSGYISVFKSNISKSTMEIPFKELLRFSHQIPSHDLTEEKDGSLRGFKELDTAAFPASFPKLR